MGNQERRGAASGRQSHGPPQVLPHPPRKPDSGVPKGREEKSQTGRQQAHRTTLQRQEARKRLAVSRTGRDTGQELTDPQGRPGPGTTWENRHLGSACTPGPASLPAGKPAGRETLHAPDTPPRRTGVQGEPYSQHLTGCHWLHGGHSGRSQTKAAWTARATGPDTTSHTHGRRKPREQSAALLTGPWTDPQHLKGKRTLAGSGGQRGLISVNIG